MRIAVKEEDIRKAVSGVAGSLNASANDMVDPLVVGILNGGVIFFADLIRELTFDFEIDFMQVKSYYLNGKPGAIEVTKHLEKEIKDRTVIVVDEFLDSGRTAICLINHLIKLSPKHIIFATLLKRKGADFTSTTPTIHGIEVGEGWLVGYGMDDDGKKRNLKQIYVK